VRFIEEALDQITLATEGKVARLWLLAAGCEGWALDGVPMGTRCGELDVGILRYLLQQLLRQCSPRARIVIECFAVASPAISPRWR
jgi:hypothetical protein